MIKYNVFLFLIVQKHAFNIVNTEYILIFEFRKIFKNIESGNCPKGLENYTNKYNS